MGDYIVYRILVFRCPEYSINHCYPSDCDGCSILAEMHYQEAKRRREREEFLGVKVAEEAKKNG